MVSQPHRPHEEHMTYPPLDTLKPVADNVWIVDGPIVHFGMPWPKMPFSTRMTVIHLREGLFVHSPTPLTAPLRAEIAAIGTPRWLIGPNRIHYSWIADWATAYPAAEIYLAPRIAEQAGPAFTLSGRDLTAREGYPWDDEIATLPIAGSYMTEVEFFHLPSRTLVLTDLIENFEADKLPSTLHRWLTRIAGVQAPDGGMPRDMRLTFARQRRQLKAAVETMIGWQPERIIIAHGRWFETDGAAALQRAFSWLLRA